MEQWVEGRCVQGTLVVCVAVVWCVNSDKECVVSYQENVGVQERIS